MGFFDFFKRGQAQPLPTRTNHKSFIAASQDRFTASWMAGAKAINEELRGDLDRLRARSRDLANNNDYARKFLRMVARNVVGPAGFTFQARVAEPSGAPDRLANNALEVAFFKWSKRGSAEIGGRMSFADLCRTVATTVARDGEALVLKVRGQVAGNPEGLAYQLIDTHRIATQMNRAAVSGENAIVMGVEVDAYQRTVAVWVKPDATSGSAKRIPADDLIHVFLPERPEQLRGIPWMHAAMLALHDLGEFNRSALLAARRGADTLGFIVSPDGTSAAMADDDAGGEAIKLSAPGTYDVLPEGYDIRTPEFAYPNTVYDSFVKTILRRVSSGLDVAYNGLGNDLEGVNYSSIRAGVLEERDQWQTLQAWFIDAFLEPVFDEWFARAMTAGVITMANGSALPVAKADKFRAHEWQGRRWSWVDPMKDIEAARLAIKSGIASPQMIAAQNGVDVEDVLDAIATFEAMAAGKKITLVDYEVTKPAAPEPDPAQAKAVAEIEASRAEEVRELRAEVRSLREKLVQPVEQKPMAVHVHQGEIRVENHIPGQEAPTVEVKVEPTPITMEANINMPEQAAPNVTVENRIDQPTPVVNVNVPDEMKISSMPTRVTTSSVERNGNGNIITTHQVEADA